ncbi:kinesin-like protein KIF26B isoform X1 [Thunnus albacares]|uniref:kinesin-like protein KIF26B isoform X1 n=1 Tax=Thunnus albacares TaxID=8236 RepID=UPI001CF61608|nr:kinesin-like protein KIF26B isoform X1 [Thunnus albacares]
MSSLTRRGERFPASVRGTHWSSEVQHHIESAGFSPSIKGKGCGCHPKERPTPEGAGGSRGDPHRNMCQRADAVPSYKSLPGSLGDRIMSSGGGTLCRGTMNPGFGRADRKVACCEKCSATLVALKKQALSLAVHHHFSCKDSSDLSAFLHENLRVHSRSTTEARDRERDQGECGACGTKLTQLKQEAVHLALSRGQSLANPPFELGLSAGTLLGQSETKHGDRSPREAATAVHQSRSRTHSPHSPQTPRSPRTPQRTPQTLRRRGPKLANFDMDRWVEEQQQLVSSAAKAVSNTDGVTIYPHRQAADAVALSCGDAGIVQTNSKIPHISRVVTIANSAAMSFLAKAAEKLNLTSRKKGQASDPAPAHLSTCFREIVQKNPPPVPSCLLQAATRTKDSPNVGKVKVVLRVSPTLSHGQGQPPVLRVDQSKKRVTIMEPVGQSQPHTTMTLGRDGRNPLRTINFDAAYLRESSQAEVCAGVLADVIRCVLSGSDGCVLGLGCADVGSWSTMVGSDENIGKLGLIPCAISWLYSAIERRREKTWTDLTVSVSAIELCCGEEDTLRDLLGEVVPSLGSIQDSPTAHIRLQEDPVYGIQLRNHNRVKAPTAERAASLLDAAIAARRHTDFTTFLSDSSIMFFTLHIQPPRTESSTIGKGSRGPTKLTMIDVCSGMRGGGHNNSKHKPPHSELGPVVLSLLSGHKTITKKSSKLTLLLRESLGHVNCHTTVIAEVADSLIHLQETLSTIQLASRIRRTQKRTKQSTSCSPCGRSLTKEKRGPQSLSLRAFHSTDEVDVDIRHFRLRGELDEHSSSDQSCDTVIQIDSDGLVQSNAAPRFAQPEFVPIIPSLHPNKTDMEDPEFTALLQELLRIPQLQGEKKKDEAVQGHIDVLKAEVKQPERDCLKCDTFAELQERLGCIDGSEITMDVLKSSSKDPPVNNVTTKSQPQKETGKQTDTESSEAQQTMNQGLGCNQTSVGEKQTDGTFPGDSFQREDSGLYDCEECSATSSSEELLNQTLSLNMTCRSELPNTGTHKSGDKLSSQDFGGDAQGMAANSSLAFALEPTSKQENHEAADWFKPDKRTSPVGKSSPISPSSSCSSSNSLAKSVIIGDVLPNRPTEDVKEMKATITVTVQQPLDLKGQDELVFSMVEEVTISGALDRGRTGGNIICIRDSAQSSAHAQGSANSQPIRIISNVSEESAAAGSSKTAKSDVVQPLATEAGTEKPQHQFRREKRCLPSFINPILINTDIDYDLDGVKEKENPNDSFTGVKSQSELRGNNAKCPEDTMSFEKKNGAFASKTHVKKPSKICDSPSSQISYDSMVLEDSAFCDGTAENKTCGKRPRNTDKSHPRDREHVYSTNTPRGSLGGENICRHVGNTPRGVGVSPGCQETALASFQTGSLPRGLQNASHQDSYHGGHVADNHRDPRGVTSSTPCSPGVTLERRQGRQCSPANHILHASSSLKYGTEYKQEAIFPPRKGVGSLFETSSVSLKHDNMSGRLKSPIEDSGRLFNAKLEQLSCRTNSLGRTPRDFPTLDRGSSNTSMSSKGSSKGRTEGACKGGYKGSSEGDCTLPRASRSPRKNPRSDHSHHFFPSENSQSARQNHSKLSAVGKLKMASPKVRRLSAPSIKNLSLSHKSLRQSINRSASLSPDGKNVGFERTSSFLSSSPPRSFHSISRTPSQSSTCSSTKSAIQGFVSGRISDLLKERATSPTSGGLDQMTTLPSPYSRVTAPRVPSHMSGHASDTTSVLSGDLPPAMGKTSLHFSNRNSMVSSGYDSMVRDSEATGSSTSNRDSVSDRSGSLLSVACSSRSSRRRGNTGTHQRLLSHDTSLPMRRSASGLRSRWVDRGIPEAYEIKVYEIDNVQWMQKRAGAGKQGPACFSAKLKFLEHRQQRISDVRAKYNNLRRELEQAKQNLLLEPAKWNQEFDLWQTFEVDSLEHLEALEVVTARLENRVNLCKANVMMVTCFDAATRRRHKKRRRTATKQKTFK